MIALGAAVALFRYRQGVVMVIVACGLIGLAVSLVRRVSGGVTLSRRSTSADLGSDPWITLRPGGLLALASAALFGATPVAYRRRPKKPRSASLVRFAISPMRDLSCERVSCRCSSHDLLVAAVGRI